MSALVALSAAFVACSSEDDFVQQKPDVPEGTVDGTPLSIKVVDATRGNYASANTLENFTLYSVANAGTTRWLGTYENGSSSGVVFDNTSDGGTGYTGVFTNGSNLLWENGTWDFYAISDATFYEESDGAEGTQDAEHLDAVTDRNFTYVVPTNYNNQKDLLVAAAIGKKSTDNEGVVSLPFQHALAQIGQITFTFTGDNAQYDNTSYFFIIKSLTLCNIKSTGKYTFPATWTANAEKLNLNNEGTWEPLDGTESEYHVEFPQFDLDDNKYYEIFVEDEVEATPVGSENEPTAFAVGTERGSTSVPNYFHCPGENGSFTYVMPLAKKEGSEGDTFGSYVATSPTGPTYTEDDGLYVLPQDLTPTVWEEDGSGNVTGVESGVYARIEGVVLNFTDPADPTTIDEAPLGWSSAENKMTICNNYYITQQLNDNIVSYLVPLEVASGKTKKVLKAGHRYNLTFNLAEAVSLNNGQHVFASEEVDP